MTLEEAKNAKVGATVRFNDHVLGVVTKVKHFKNGKTKVTILDGNGDLLPWDARNLQSQAEFYIPVLSKPTLAGVKKLKIDRTIYSTITIGYDGKPIRWRVNGKLKLWKTCPKDFRLPLKCGLHEHTYLGPGTLDRVRFNEVDAMRAYLEGQGEV